MLQAIRDRVVGWVAWGVVIIISVPFIVLGVTDFGGPPRENVVAEVNEEKIVQRDYRYRFDGERRAMQRRLGANYRPDIFDRQLQQTVIDTMVEEKLLDILGEANNLQVGDEELASVIQSDPGFQRDGKFNFDQYRAVLGQSGFTPETYEQYLRASRNTAVIPRVIRSSSFLTSEEARRLNALLNQQRDFDYVIIGRDQFPEEVAVSDENARNYYEKHPQDFIRPEQVRIEYIELDAKQLAGSVEVNEENIRRYYDEHIDRYRVDEQRKASHILLTMEKGKFLRDSPEVQRKLQEIQAKLNAGEQFEDLARQYSEDPGSAQQGGDLGQVLRGVMVPPFEKALYALTEKGQISEPVRTSFGLHLIRLDDITPAQTKSFDDVKADIEQDYANNQAVDMFYDQSERMAEVSYENPDSLAPVAEILNIPLQTSDWMAMNNDVEGIEGNREVLRMAFNERLKAEGINSDPIEVGENHAVIIRVMETRPQSQIPFEEVIEQARSAAKQSVIDDKVVAFAEEFRARLDNGESLQDIAASQQLTVESARELKRNSKDVPAALSQGVFSMPAPEDSQPTVASLPLAGGKQALVILHSITSPGGKIDAAISKELAASDGMRTAQMLLSGLREKSTVVIYKDKL